MHIRRYKLEDAEAIYKIDQCFLHPYELFEIIANAGSEDRLVILNHHEALVGYIFLEYVSAENATHINDLAIAAAFQGQGLGGLLLAAAAGHALSQRAAAVTLDVAVGNEVAIRLYKKFGFEIVEIVDKYYPDGEDSYYMRMNLS